MKFLYQYMKKNSIYRTQTIEVKTAHENHTQLLSVIPDHNPLILIVFVEDHKIDKIHLTLHKTNIVDQYSKQLKQKRLLYIEFQQSKYSNHNRNRSNLNTRNR